MSDESPGGIRMKRGEALIAAIAGLLLFGWWMQNGFRIPFVHARTSSGGSCFACLSQIDGAVQQWALEFKKTPADTYSLTDPKLLMFFKGSVLPVCPKGGRYTAGTNVGDVPHCTIPGHTL